jgi:hypothetical protein
MAPLSIVQASAWSVRRVRFRERVSGFFQLLKGCATSESPSVFGVTISAYPGRRNPRSAGARARHRGGGQIERTQGDAMGGGDALVQGFAEEGAHHLSLADAVIAQHQELGVGLLRWFAAAVLCRGGCASSRGRKEIPDKVDLSAQTVRPVGNVTMLDRPNRLDGHWRRLGGAQTSKGLATSQ